ncbi:MAG TPA: hypothetical protein VHU81_09685 [Thermoanaerobaculia bacterium]|nr:hypothetical protein [Thermoanaerobaculia bacterium]
MRTLRFSTLHLIALSLLATLPATPAGAADSGPLDISLRYVPQESVGTSVANLPLGINERPVTLSMEDGRTGAEAAVIGETTDDDDRVWPVRSANLVPYINEVLTKTAGEWGIRTDPGAPLKLSGKLMRFKVSESNKAVGSTYNADVQVGFTLRNAKGQTLWQGTSAGDATRYGRARSAENMNEVLSDALKEAYAGLFNDSGLQNAWMGNAKPIASGSSSGAASSGAGGAIAPQALLDELVKLKKQGFTPDLLVDYVNQKSISPALSADDMVRWKNAGMPQEVIKAALDRGPAQ